MRRLGWLAVGRLAWNNRGHVLRAVDLARRAPVKLRSDASSDLMTELRAFARLATEPGLAKRTDVRIGSVGEGCVVLRGPSGDVDVERARSLLLDLGGIVDVRADAADARVSPLTGSGSEVGDVHAAVSGAQTR